MSAVDSMGEKQRRAILESLIMKYFNGEISREVLSEGLRTNQIFSKKMSVPENNAAISIT